MANSYGETVGDMIVRQRLEEMEAHPERAAEIRERFTPRSLRHRKWPLRQDAVR